MPFWVEAYGMKGGAKVSWDVWANWRGLGLTATFSLQPRLAHRPMEGNGDCCQRRDREDVSAVETLVSAVVPLGSMSLRISVCVSMASGKPINNTR